MAIRDLYVDPLHVNANDSNAGTSSNLPWLTPPGLKGASTSRVILPNDRILVPSKHKFTLSNLWWNPYFSGTQGNPIQIETFGGSDPAIFDARELITGFTLQSPNIWRADINSRCKRLFDPDGNPLAKATSQGALDSTRVWWDEQPAAQWHLYVFSATDPSGLVYANLGANAFCLEFDDQNYLEVRNIRTEGGSSAGIGLRGFGQGHIIEEVEIRQSNYGINCQQNTTGEEITDVQILNCDIDAAVLYGEWDVASNPTPQTELMDAVYLGPGCKNFIVRSNKLKDFSHSMVKVFGTTTNPVTDTSDGHIIEDNHMEVTTSDYCRGPDLYGASVNSTKNVICRFNRCSGLRTKSHIRGNNLKFYGNVFENSKATERDTISTQCAMNITASNKFDMTDLDCYDNVVLNSEVPAVRIRNESSTNFSNLKIHDNKWHVKTSVIEIVHTNMTNTAAWAPVTDFTNNLLGRTVGETVLDVNGTTYDISQLNTLSGVTSLSIDSKEIAAFRTGLLERPPSGNRIRVD